ncbi:MAG: aspartate kinase, partial [Anaerolineaceae bacterium]|nr:aspartate kinase [Anaerolineaceae bacterium]
MAENVYSKIKKTGRPLVMKFGGTSVGSSDALMQAAKIIKEERQNREKIVVVVSAMSGITDLLIASAKDAAVGNEAGFLSCLSKISSRHLGVINELPFSEHSRKKLIAMIEMSIEKLHAYCVSIQTLGEVTPRGLDAVASLGERMNVRQLSELLLELNIPSLPIDADELIITDSNFQNAHPLREPTLMRINNMISPLLSEGKIPIVTGFISGTENGITTTLGRGGSDYTAAVLGDCLDAQEVWTWTDVDGVMTADPSVVSDAKVISQLTFDEVSEMAYFGAKVLHPKTMRPLMEKSIPLWVKNTFNPSFAGTCISNSVEQKTGKITCVTTIKDVSLITVRGKGMLGVPGVAARTFSAVAKEKASVLMISQSSSEQSICFVIPSSDEIRVMQSLK